MPLRRQAADDWSAGEGEGAYPDAEPASAPPAAYSAGSPSLEPEFRPIDSRGRTTRRLEEERRIGGGEEVERPLSYFTRRTGILDVLVAFLFLAIGYFSVMLTYSGIGHAWDEALYLKAAQRSAEWAQGVARGESFLLTPEGIENDWGGPFEGLLHPEVGPVPKLVTGLGYQLLPEHGFPPMTAGRLPVAAAFGFTLALIYLMGTAEYGRIGGFAAAFAYLLMPRVFGHAHIAASETLLAFAIALTTWTFLAGIARWPLAILLTAPAFALALGTKVTAFFLPIPFLIWGQFYRRRDYGSNLFAMLLLSPALLVAIWPWLWHDGPGKLLSWLNFYATHQSTAVWYLGRKWGYGAPPAPWHYPFVIMAASLPLWIGAFAAVGIVRAVLQIVARPVPVLFLLLAGTFLGISALPGSPKYDGERLFFPVFLFLALLAGGGFSGLAAISRHTALGMYYRPGVNRSLILRHQNIGAALFLIGFALWGGWVVYRSHPNELNYFNGWVGGAEGADDLGLETSYWGEGVNEEVTEYLTEVVQPGQKVKVLALEPAAFEHLQQWGRLPEDIDFSPDAPPYDWYVLQNRKGFFGNLERTLFTRKPTKSFDFNGVPRILVYRGDVLPLSAPGTAVADGATTGPAAAPEPVEAAEPGIVPAPGTASEAVTTETVETTGTTETPAPLETGAPAEITTGTTGTAETTETAETAPATELP